MTLEIVEPGPLTTVQTPDGRPGWQRFGVPVGGAADPWSARLANRLVGNPDDAPLLEATLAGPTLRFASATLVAIVGAEWRATLDGLPLPANQARPAGSGATLQMGTGAGARAYVAVAGLAVQPVLGSAATDLRTGFGGHAGRALRAGDRLTIAAQPGRPMRWRGVAARSDPIRVLPGPHASWFAPDVLTGAAWRVSEAADRTGARLEGEMARSGEDAEIPSIGLPLGAVQVPPDGRPIVMLADRPVTGGYPVPGCVIRADIGRVAQLRPGDALRFASVSVEEAIEALRKAEADLEDLEPFSLTSDDELGWAGALDN
ncbi:MAG: biotin-dependent carboxyltransferase family protein [Chloroflexi bacterium]|nr:biotin-dependent carboxyltransferase family protein [Chloroflexota bacterium]